MEKLAKMTPFERKVLVECAKIPKGQVRNYGEIARAIGKPKAFRAVANALGKNPYPIRIPCHRVIRSDGTLAGVLERKKAGQKRSWMRRI